MEAGMGFFLFFLCISLYLSCVRAIQSHMQLNSDKIPENVAIEDFCWPIPVKNLRNSSVYVYIYGGHTWNVRKSPAEMH